jgi:putative redox protein
MKATSVWVDNYRSVVDNGRGHSVVLDLPREQNGADTGATALELCVMSLAGCITTIFRTVAEKRRFAYRAFRVEFDAEKPKEALTVTRLKARMELVTEGDEKEAQTVLKLTWDACPVGSIFDKAGIKVDYQLTVRKP